MLNVTKMLTAEMAKRFDVAFDSMFSGTGRTHVQHAKDAASAALDHIATCDALYHNVEHTVHVTIVGLEILKAKHALELSVTPRDWLNIVVALLCHDIGYVRGICRGDDGERLANGIDGQSTRIASRRSDAALMPIHVDRGKKYVAEQYEDLSLVDVPVIQECIERTRFPVPLDPAYQRNDDLPGLVRGADLIGQLSDPRYLYKMAAIFYEFEEIGFNKGLGYGLPGDLLDAYPVFFEKSVGPFIADSIRLLESTAAGREIVDNLYTNLDAARRPSAFSVDATG